MAFDSAAYFKSLVQSVPIGTTAEQLEGAAKAELINQKAGFDDIANWSLLNANMQSHLLAAKSAGLGAESVIPYGSSTYNVTTTVNNPATPSPAVQPATPVVPPAPVAVAPTPSLTKTALTALASALLGAGGVGAAAGWFTPTKEPPPLTPQQYEWVLEVEREYAGRITGGTSGAGGSGSDSGGPSVGDSPADSGNGASNP